MMEQHAGMIVIVILLIASLASAPWLFGVHSTDNRRQKRVKKSRAQHEAELERMWKEEINPAPPTKAERARWAKENNQTYIENVAAHAYHENWTDKDGEHHWRETVIDNFGNEVEVHNSEGTGTRD